MENGHEFSSSGLTVAILKEKLKSLDLPCSGNKQALEKRLDNYYKENNTANTTISKHIEDTGQITAASNQSDPPTYQNSTQGDISNTLNDEFFGQPETTSTQCFQSGQQNTHQIDQDKNDYETDSDDDDDDDDDGIESLRTEMNQLKCEISFIKNVIINQGKNDNSNGEKQALQQKIESLSEIINIQKEEITQLKSSEQNLLKVISLLSTSSVPHSHIDHCPFFSGPSTRQPAPQALSHESKKPNQNDSSILEINTQTSTTSDTSKTKQKKKANKKNKPTDSSSQVNNNHLNKPTEDGNRGANSPLAKNKQSSVIILGDSMVKNIHGYRMKNRVGTRVIVHPFNGAKSKDFVDYSKPSARDHPYAKTVIIHAGNNDISTVKGPREVAEEIIDTTQSIAHSFPKSKIAISLIIKRNDNPELNDKINQANKTIKTFCNQRNWGWISNDNIGTSLLNNSGLHLNKKGDAVLANNLVSFLTST